MDICGNCGRTRKQGTLFCTGCGHRFTDNAPAESYAPTETHVHARPYEPANPGPPNQPRRSRMFRPAVVATMVILVAAAAGVGGALLYTRHHAPHTEAARNSARSTRTTPGASATQGGSPSDQGSPEPSASPSDISPSPSETNAVTVTSGASGDPNASSVADFLGQYFAAINAHDYQSYLSLLSPQLQQEMTPTQFAKGYRSTADSNETLVGISTAIDGDLAAEVTFTSHQDRADSPDQRESCTNWDISLFLGQGGSGYVIDPAPSGYQASYQPCL